MIDPSSLNLFSRSFLETLRQAFPDLAARAVVDPNGDPDGSLLVKFAPDESRPSVVFGVYSDNDEVTVSFDTYHTHFHWPEDQHEKDWWMNPLSFIEALRNDMIVVEVRRKAGKWTGSGVLLADEKLDLSDIDEDTVVSIRSWSGQLDRNVPVRVFVLLRSLAGS